MGPFEAKTGMPVLFEVEGELAAGRIAQENTCGFVVVDSDGRSLFLTPCELCPIREDDLRVWLAARREPALVIQ